MIVSVLINNKRKYEYEFHESCNIEITNKNKLADKLRKRAETLIEDINEIATYAEMSNLIYENKTKFMFLFHIKFYVSFSYRVFYQ